jgi:hypothetical protein
VEYAVYSVVGAVEWEGVHAVGAFQDQAGGYDGGGRAERWLEETDDFGFIMISIGKSFL